MVYTFSQAVALTSGVNKGQVFRLADPQETLFNFYGQFFRVSKADESVNGYRISILYKSHCLFRTFYLVSQQVGSLRKDDRSGKEDKFNAIDNTLIIALKK